MTETANNILNQIGIKDVDNVRWNDIHDYNTLKNLKVIEKGEPIFMRLNVEEEVAFLKDKMKK